jgi:hypothetical protein
MITHACEPSYKGGMGRAITIRGLPQDLTQKITRVKKGYRHDSSNRVPVYEVQGPEYKPQHQHQEQNVSSLPTLKTNGVSAQKWSQVLSPKQRSLYG